MASQIILKKSSITARVPVVGDLAYGELALNYADGVLYYKKSDGTTIGTIGSGADTLATVTARGSQAIGSITIGSSGPYAAGSIYSDANWGMIFRARQASPTNKEFMWSTSTDTNLMTLSTAGALNAIGAITGSNLSGTNTGDQTLPTTLPNPNAITFNSSGGAAAGSTYTGAAVLTVDYATVGAAAASHTHSYQAADGDLLAIGGLTGTTGLLRKTAADTWTLDTSTFLTSIPLTSTYVGFGSGSNTLTGSAALRWDSSTFQMTGQTAFDSMTSLNVVNGSGDYGRAQIRIVGRIQGSNDGWALGGRNNLIFAANSAASGVSLGSTGVDKFALQYQMESDVLGFVSAAVSASPILAMTQVGNVGIGTTPISRFHVAGGGIGTRGAIRISDEGGTNYWEIGRDNTSTGNFTVNLNATEFLRIDNAGSTSINSTTDGIFSLNKSSGSAWNYINFKVADTRKFYFGINASNEPELGTDNASSFRVNYGMTVGGNVGIGTTNPPNKLTISNGGAVGLEISPTGNYTTLGGIDLLAYNRSASVYAPIGFITNSSNNSMVILTNGNVGVGTTAPVSKLHVAGAGNVTGGNIHMGDNTDGSQKWTYLTGAHYNGATNPTGFALIGGLSQSTVNAVVIGGSIYETNPATEIQFWTHTATTHATGGTQRMIINGSGNVGIGTQSPTQRLHVVGSNSGGGGYTGIFENATDGTNNGGGYLFQNNHSNHSWGAVAEFRTVTGTAGSDRPSVIFSSDKDSISWSTGFVTGSDNSFRIVKNHGHRAYAGGWSGTNGGWGTEYLIINTLGTVNVPGILQQGGNQVLHAGNYTSYSPTLTGGSASGTWGINITGNAATATTAANLSTSSPIYRTAAGAGYLNGGYSTYENTTTSGAIYSIGGSYVPGTTTLGNMYGVGYTYSQAVGNPGGAPNSVWGLYGASGGTARWFLDSDVGRGYFGGALYSDNGNVVLNASNYSSYALPLSGGTLTGALNISVAPNGRSLSLGGDQTDRVYNDTARASLVINATDYPHFYINATTQNGNTNHGAVFSMTGNLTTGGYRRWGMGIANTDPDCFSWGYYDNNTNPHYSVGGTFGYTDTGAKMWLNTSGSLMTTGDMRAPIFYDSNNTNYFVDPASNSFISSLSVNVGQESTGAANSSSAGLVLRGSYNSNTWAHKFHKYDNGSGLPMWLSYTAGTGAWTAAQGWGPGLSYTSQVYGSFRADGIYSNIFYDADNTGYYLDAAGTSSLNRISTVRTDNFLYMDNNYGHSIVGAYSPNRYQGVFAMGDAYKLPADGTTTGSLYGLAWSHPNAGGVAGNLNTHGLLVMENGTFLAAVSGSIRARDDMRAPIFYDSNNTAYYTDPNSTSNLCDLYITGAAHKYLRINPGNGYEAMVHYNGGSGSAWYVGKRTTNQTVSTNDFHFYSEAAGKTVAGIDTSGNMVLTGSLSAITKSFLIDHPTKPGMKLRYGSLEGPENGVYVRGKLRGNKIELPEYWTKLVDPDSITVNLTAIGKSQNLYVEDIKDNVVYVGGKNVNCFYTVFAERVDVAKLEVEIA